MRAVSSMHGDNDILRQHSEVTLFLAAMKWQKGLAMFNETKTLNKPWNKCALVDLFCIEKLMLSSQSSTGNPKKNDNHAHFN